MYVSYTVLQSQGPAQPTLHDSYQHIYIYIERERSARHTVAGRPAHRRGGARRAPPWRGAARPAQPRRGESLRVKQSAPSAAGCGAPLRGVSRRPPTLQCPWRRD